MLDLSRLIPSVVNALTAIDRLLELERLPAEADGDSIFLASTPELELKDVTFGYTPDNRPVFSRFSCRFPAGSCIAVVGETRKRKDNAHPAIVGTGNATRGTDTLDTRQTST